jgi:hypothetical protein
MSRPPGKPAPRYTLADAAGEPAQIRMLRADARDSDLDARFPIEVMDDAEVAAVIGYTHTTAG